MLRASALVERLGIPAVSIVTDAFVGIATAIAEAEGIPGHPLAVLPHVIMTESVDSIKEAAQIQLVDQIIEGFVLSHEEVHPDVASVEQVIPDWSSPVAVGSLWEIEDIFENEGWTDGLPIIPPTLKAVESFLANCPREPDEVLGVLPPLNCEATIWNVAVNGVMAGCRSEYMPLLVAIVEAILDPVFRLEDAGSTPGWEPLVIVSGPMVKDLNFNYLGGAMRTGRRANTTIGRFLRLIMRNVGGLRVLPGNTDKGTIGMPFNVALAENEEVVRELGWPTFAEERGFQSGENVVTVQSIVSMSAPTYSGGVSPLEHARTLAEVIGVHWSYKTWDSIYFDEFHPLLVISPGIARVFGRGGWTKQDLRNYFREHILVTAESVERYAWQASGIKIDLMSMVAQGRIEPEYALSNDPNRLVPALRQKAKVGIIVAGDPGRNQSRGYIQMHRQGVPTSRRVSG